MRDVTWRPTRLMRVAYIIVGTLLGALALGGLAAAVLSPDTLPWSLIVSVLVGGGAVAFYLAATRSSLTAANEGVTVRSIAATVTIPWEDIMRCTPSYSGILIARRDGSVVRASAVQKSNYATMSGRRTRADDVAEELERRLSPAP